MLTSSLVHIFTALIPREACPGNNCSDDELCEITSFNPLRYGCHCKEGFVRDGKSCSGKSCYDILILILLKKQVQCILSQSCALLCVLSCE